MKTTTSLNNSIKLTLPIYRKMRGGKEELLGWNQYVGMHFRSRASLKDKLHSMVTELAKGQPAIDGVFSVRYDLYFRNARCDMSNVVGFAEKYMLDALQLSGHISNDNVNHHIGSSSVVIERDKDNPRLEITISKLGVLNEMYNDEEVDS